MSNGVASKIIVPTDAVNMTKSNVLFAETTGIGDTTKPAEVQKQLEKQDICCEDDTSKKTKKRTNKK